MIDKSPANRLIGCGEPRDGMMTVYVACASKQTRDNLQNAWA